MSIDETLLTQAREHARSNGTTFNQMVRDLVAKEVAPDPVAKMHAVFDLADKLARSSDSRPMSREEAH